MTVTQYTGEWRAAGACLAADPEIFFPVSGTGASTRQIAGALQICSQCRVRRECFDFAMRNGETYGIWGGTTPEDRDRIRRAASARRRQASRAMRIAGPARAS